MKRFCPKCGKETEKFYENLCEECFLAKISFLSQIPDRIILKECKFCERFFLNDKPQPLNQAIEKFLLRNLESENIESITYRITENKLYLTINAKIYGLRKTEEKVCELIKKFITCKFCRMKQTGYHQVIIQVRGNKEFFGEILRKIESGLEKLRKTDELAFISKIDRNDILDIYIGSTSAATKVVNWVRKFFKIKTKLTKKLAGIKSGKRIYKTTILVQIS